jgi:hypothetical protein
LSRILRRWPLTLLVFAAACPGCLPQQPGFVVAPARTMQSNAHAHALQTASFSYAFMNGHFFGWPSELDTMKSDGIALLEALKAQGYGIELGVVPRREGKDEVYDVELSFPKQAAAPAGGNPAASRASQGKKPAKSEDAPPAAPSTVVGPPPGVDPVVFMKGRLALARIAGFMTQLNVSNDTLQRHAFALLVLKEKIKNGEKADWFDPNRPAAESNADIDLALRIIADHHAQIQVFRSHVLTILALAGAMEAPSALDELRQELDQERARAQNWQATHRQPTADDYGVKAEALPTPDAFVQKLDVDVGMLKAVIQTAQGVASGSPQMTLDGLAALAPEDSSVGVVLQGLSAAGHGDIQGTLESVAKLTGHEADVQDITERLGRVGSVLKTLRGLTSAPVHAVREVARPA